MISWKIDGKIHLINHAGTFSLLRRERKKMQRPKIVIYQTLGVVVDQLHRCTATADAISKLFFKLFFPHLLLD